MDLKERKNGEASLQTAPSLKIQLSVSINRADTVTRGQKLSEGTLEFHLLARVDCFPSSQTGTTAVQCSRAECRGWQKIVSTHLTRRNCTLQKWRRRARKQLVVSYKFAHFGRFADAGWRHVHREMHGHNDRHRSWWMAKNTTFTDKCSASSAPAAEPKSRRVIQLAIVGVCVKFYYDRVLPSLNGTLFDVTKSYSWTTVNNLQALRNLTKLAILVHWRLAHRCCQLEFLICSFTVQVRYLLILIIQWLVVDQYIVTHLSHVYDDGNAKTVWNSHRRTKFSPETKTCQQIVRTIQTYSTWMKRLWT